MNESERTYAKSVVDRPNGEDDLWWTTKEHKRSAIMISSETKNNCIDMISWVQKCEQCQSFGSDAFTSGLLHNI